MLKGWIQAHQLINVNTVRVWKYMTYLIVNYESERVQNTYSVSSLLFNMVLEIPAIAIDKKNK